MGTDSNSFLLRYLLISMFYFSICASLKVLVVDAFFFIRSYFISTLQQMKVDTKRKPVSKKDLWNYGADHLRIS